MRRSLNLKINVLPKIYQVRPSNGITRHKAIRVNGVMSDEDLAFLLLNCN